MTEPAHPCSLREIVRRSLFPLVAMMLLLTAPWLSAPVFLLMTLCWWRLVTRWA